MLEVLAAMLPVARALLGPTLVLSVSRLAAPPTVRQ